jgi:hypothetical protein
MRRLLLACAVAVSLVCACGGNDDRNDEPTTSSNPLADAAGMLPGAPDMGDGSMMMPTPGLPMSDGSMPMPPAYSLPRY